MNMLCWPLLLLAHTLPQACCLRDSLDVPKWEEQGHSLEMMATSIKKLTELWEKVDRRLDEQDKVIHELKASLGVRGEKTQGPALAAPEENKLSGRTESRFLDKRSDDLASWEPVVAQVTQRVNQANADIQVLKNSVAAQEQARGSAYTRWGQSACPSSAELVYSGFVGGSWYGHSGAASNYLCLPPDPTYDNHTVPRYGHANLYGAEYETCDEPECNLLPTCAVCRISRESSLMLPGRSTCYPGWTLEYSGYIMTNSYGQPAGTEYVCVDSSHGYVPSDKSDDNGALLYYTTYQCGSLPCPPYIADKIVLCAVCSK